VSDYSGKTGSGFLNRHKCGIGEHKRQLHMTDFTKKKVPPKVLHDPSLKQLGFVAKDLQPLNVTKVMKVCKGMAEKCIIFKISR